MERAVLQRRVRRGAIVSLTLYVIIDIEFPRVGFIRVHAMDSVLQEVRDSMR